VDGKVIRQAEVNGALCKGCGMCVPVCPNNAIQLEGWRIDQYDAMVDAIVSDF
jgi:heterodisulfide reductase subunit A